MNRKTDLGRDHSRRAQRGREENINLFRMWKSIPIVSISLLVVAGGLCFAARTRDHSPAKGASAEPVDVSRIVEFVRERWGMPDNVKVSATAFRDAALPGYQETTLTVVNGGQTQNQTVFWSKADKRVIVG